MTIFLARRVEFVPPFPSGEIRPYVVVQAASEPGQSYPDVHSIVVHEIDRNGFNATVLRADSLGHGWMGSVRMHYLAWLPTSG